jgi:hypothetical protein
MASCEELPTCQADSFVHGKWVTYKPGFARLRLSFTPLLLPAGSHVFTFSDCEVAGLVYIAARAALDQTGTDGSLYRYRLAPDRLGGQNVSGSAPAG